MSKLNIIHFETLPSTNTYAKENAEKILLPALIIADGQTNGRGRRGKSFFSPSGTGLYMTLVFKAPDNCELITCAAAVSVCRELEALGAKPEIKWVNDVFSDGHKVCGILTEMDMFADRIDHVIVGTGVNVNQTMIPEELSQSATSLYLETGRTHQIRIHMKSIGSPLIGDYLYNPDMEWIHRQALHSHKMSFIHPITGKYMEFTAPMPEDMQRIISYSI